MALPDGRRFVPVEEVIAAHLDTLFPAMTIVEHHVFRVTRNADLTVDEGDAQDLLAAVELELHRRRFGQAVRLEVAAGTPEDLFAMLVTEVEVPEDNVFLSDVPLDLGGLRDLADLGRPDLAPEPWTPLGASAARRGRDLFDVLAEGDVLLHHPYESFAASVEAFVERAAADPDVLAIRQTLYRTGTTVHHGRPDPGVPGGQAGHRRGGAPGPVRRAGQHRLGPGPRGGGCPGRLRARPDEDPLEDVPRDPAGGDATRRYCHVGSGNYNSVTAPTYEDVGVLTADPDIGADLAEVFNLLTGAGSELALRRLVVSPVSTRDEVIAAIDDEAAAGPSGRIVLKTNGLTDPDVIDALYRASARGARSTSSYGGGAASVPGCPDCRSTSPCVRSSAGSSSTRGCSVSGATTADPCGSGSARPT